MCAYALIPKSKREEDIIKSVNVILARERKPLTLGEICEFLRGVSRAEVQSIAFQNPNNFECFEDGQLFVKQITKVGICELHTQKNKTCPGSIPFCTGLHICKYYILSGRCPFGGQCTFGHDLTIAHNMKVLKENYLEHVAMDDLKYLFSRAESRTSVTVPKICKFYNVDAGCRYSESGKVCPNLHICKHYIKDKCRYGRSCRRSHNVISKDIKDILEKHGISTRRTPKEILADLREAVMQAGSEGSSVGSSPLVRSFSDMNIYPGGGGHISNSGNNEGSAMFRQQGRGRKKKAKPKVPADLPRPPVPVQGGRPQTVQAPRNAGAMSGQRPPCAPRAPRASSAQRPPRASSAQRPPTSGRSSISQQISTDQNSTQVICFFHLRGRCAFGESCRNFHADLPYQWVYKHQGDDEWQVLPAPVNLELELTYSDPVNQEYYMDIGQKVKIIFKTMTGTSIDGQNYDVHRFSTASSVEFERQPLTTEWVWYWKDQIGEWRKYGEDNMTGYKADISSTHLEQAYIANPDGNLAFSTLGHEYILDFPKMVQRNLHYKTEREVCRRPVFISRQDFEKKKTQAPTGRGSGQVRGAAGGVGMVTAPPNWQITPGSDITDHCQIVEVLKKYPSTRKEYKEIESLFCESMPSTVSVKSIERVENGDLWCNYVSKKAKMLKKNNNKDVGERRLFHGTPNTYVDAICRQGFDFRLSGQTSGTKYGKGSYFATTSKYSDCYTDQTNRVMFVVKVLVGEYAKGSSKYVRPPSKDKSNPCSELYDSCVDDQQNPTIFVIFDNSGQVYPEYLIRYEYKYV